MPQNLWNENAAQQRPELDGLVYRSNLLGSDRTVVNIYGGNTSAKLGTQNHLGQSVEVLWVKGSGSDVATITEKGFAGLRQAEITPLMARAQTGRWRWVPTAPTSGRCSPGSWTFVAASSEREPVDVVEPVAVEVA